MDRAAEGFPAFLLVRRVPKRTGSSDSGFISVRPRSPSPRPGRPGEVVVVSAGIPKIPMLTSKIAQTLPWINASEYMAW